MPVWVFWPASVYGFAVIETRSTVVAMQNIVAQKPCLIFYQTAVLLGLGHVTAEYIGCIFTEGFIEPSQQMIQKAFSAILEDFLILCQCIQPEGIIFIRGIGK